MQPEFLLLYVKATIKLKKNLLFITHFMALNGVPRGQYGPLLRTTAQELKSRLAEIQLPHK